MCIVIFITDFCIERKRSATNQLNRGVIIMSYSIVGLVFFVFSYRLLTEIKRSLHGPVAIRNARKVRIVLFVFMFAIIYRIIYNVAYLAAGSKMCDFNNRNPRSFALFLSSSYILCEALPMMSIFGIHGTDLWR